MVSALGRKPWRDLKRHKLRALLAVVTIAATVAGLWLLAVPAGIGDSMTARARIDRLDDILVKPNNLWHEAPPPAAEISPDELAGLRDLPGVAGVLATAIYTTEARIGDRVEQARLVGVPDFAAMEVNAIAIREGTAPVWDIEELRVLSETANGRNGRFDGSTGATIEIKAGDGVFYPASVTGRASTLRWTEHVAYGNVVLYVPIELVHVFTATEGFNSIEIRATDRSPQALESTLDGVRTYLAGVAPEATYWGASEVRDPNVWPGKENIDRFKPLLYVLAATALLSAMVLVSTTMTTLVREQRRDIGVMKAMGARRGVIARSFVAAAVILGTAGTIVGTVLGLLTSRELGEYVTVQLMGVDSVWTIAPWFVAASVAVGIGGTAAAALPAVLRATGVPVKEVLTNPGIDTRFGGSRVERAVSRASFLPRLTRIGLGNAARSRRRTIATAIQIALGVGTALGFAAFSVTGITVSNRTLENESGDIRLVWGQGGRALDTAAAELAAAVPGVAEVQPIIYGTVELAGDTRSAWGLPAEPIYEPDLVDGRWFSHADIAAVAPVAVIGEPMAEIIAAQIGDRIEVETQSGVKTVEVIGVDRTLVTDGQYVWLPLSTAVEFHQATFDYALWVDATDDDPGFIDAVAADLGAGLSAAGYRPRTFLHYQELATARAEDRVVVIVIMVLGLPIVAIGMIGLVSAMTTSMLERTREIGILRSLGASKRHLRSLLRAEGIAVAALGWVIGIPVGYVLARVIVWQFGRAMHTSLGLIYPWWLAPAALVLVVIAARLTLRLPMRRAVRMPPATALRYE